MNDIVCNIIPTTTKHTYPHQMSRSDKTLESLPIIKKDDSNTINTEMNFSPKNHLLYIPRCNNDKVLYEVDSQINSI